jgi:hypothetical protein
MDLSTEAEINPFYSKDRLKTIFRDQDVDEKQFIIPKSIR